MTERFHRIAPGDVIQIKPDSKSLSKFGGLFAVVEEVKKWGVKAYAPGIQGVYPLRVPNQEFALVGVAAWVIEPLLKDMILVEQEDTDGQNQEEAK